MSTPLPIDNLPAAAAPARVGQATAIEQSRAVAEVQAAIVVAQQVPRRIDVARNEMRMSCGILGLAEQAFYRYPKGGSTVTGASVHLARELARCFGNIQYGIAELRRDDDFAQSEMQAWAWDVQTNTRSSNTFIVPHMRDKKGGPQKLVELRDIYENNANMGARRLREAIFSILPKWFTEEAKELCNATLERGDGTPLADRIEGAVKAFDGLGVSVDRLVQQLGRPREKWNNYDIAQLTTTYKSIQRGEIAIDEAFPQQRVTVDEITQGNGSPGGGVSPVESPSVAGAGAGSTPATTAPPPGPKARAASKAQLTAVNTLLGTKLGATTDEQRFARLADRFERPFTSSAELTFDEAKTLIDDLGALPEASQVESGDSGELFGEGS